ncbi:hypothetical protein [Corynebacterium cystitidis]|uniref:X-X-X-Leu-X-X-Gly heptad repeat-containing protein n=1 Tax=Corynebacterium cystitidis DSM 20524 TaxID=1121357 RepID=A0A1H9UAE0_9CORY|nr:hypothetical protein [Corynebacterium cystitidis]WJY81248.1 hypothetical protein CCYS_01355 [Corynebacterium cystitidis DSM 20524]SES06127.1 X-X-X-Leu-X-X-Gly heptad repeat-containing protein [Corynebacterium cystitidis DSM 20524]SNV88968.1 membrane protein [Corynebacterium cystitidis]
MKTRLLLALVILVIGAFVPMSPAETWTTGDEPMGAPATYAGPDNLVDARRAAGEAHSQAGFLTNGTTQLKEGSEDLKDGMQELADGAETARSGAESLAGGMNELNAGMGQLGGGANQVADGVSTAVDTVVGFEAVKGQILGTIDRTLEETEGATDPDIVDARNALSDLRGQVETAQLPEDIVDQLNQLRDGSREISNQLTTPGFAFYDGMSSATSGATDLSNGMTELRDGANTARDGSQDLFDGASQVDTMAGNTKTKIEDIQGAIPGPTPQQQQAMAGPDKVTASALSPLVAMLIAALMVLGGLALALAAFVVDGSRRAIIGFGTAFLTVVGLVLVMVLGVGLSPLAMLMIGAGLVLGVLASAGLSWMLLAACGPRGGATVAALFAAVQVGGVGWLWKSASVASVSGAWKVAVGLMPLHWTTTTLSSSGNVGSSRALWISLALATALAVLGVVAMARGRVAPAGVVEIEQEK